MGGGPPRTLCFAALSASTFPGTSHWITMNACYDDRRDRRSSIDGLIPSSTWHSDWLSVHTITGLSALHSLTAHTDAMLLAVTSSSNELVCTLPCCLMVSIIRSSAGSPFVTTATSPPSSLPLLADPSVYIIRSPFSFLLWFLLMLYASFIDYTLTTGSVKKGNIRKYPIEP